MHCGFSVRVTFSWMFFKKQELSKDLGQVLPINYILFRFYFLIICTFHYILISVTTDIFWICVLRIKICKRHLITELKEKKRKKKEEKRNVKNFENPKQKLVRKLSYASSVIKSSQSSNFNVHIPSISAHWKFSINA